MVGRRCPNNHGSMSNEPTPEFPDRDGPDNADEVSADPTVFDDVADDATDDAEFATPEWDDDVFTGQGHDDEIYTDPMFSDPMTDSFDDTAGTGGYVPPEAPPYVAAPPVRRLVRDPYSRLGGVSSGIAHHTGVDVSLVRLGFVIATFFSGIGLILYLLAWLIVPRAEYWPPAPYEAGSGGSVMEGKQLAYGLLAVGILMVIFTGGGGFARLLVSVGLVGAGIWMLVQPSSDGGTGPRSGSTPPGSAVPGSRPVPATNADLSDHDVDLPADGVPATWQPSPGEVGPDITGDDLTSSLPGADWATSTASTVASAPVKTVYVPSPVPPRRRRIWPLLLLGAVVFVPIVAIGSLITVVALNEDGFSDADVLVEPLTPPDIPGRIDEGAGAITLDLRNLSLDDFADADGSPQEVEIDLNAGEVIVELPADLPVVVDASAGAGEINVGDENDEGIRPRVSTSDDDAVLELDIRVGVGSITVDN